MVDNKKIAKTAAETAAEARAAEAKAQSDIDTNKATATQLNADPGTVVRTSEASPAESVKEPTVGEVKNPVAPKGKADNIQEHVDATKRSVEESNKAAEAVAKAKPFVKADENLAKTPTADERLKEQVERVAQSTEEYNKSAKEELKTQNSNGVNTKPEVSRVAPLTGELRKDPEEDSYVTVGKVLAPVSPKPGDPPLIYAPMPLMIAPLSGEIKPQDEISYPTPGHVRDPNAVMDVSDMKMFQLDSTKTAFGVPEGHQASLLRANEEMWKNDEAARNDQKARAQEIADALVSSDGLRRTRRAQKNLR